jgi:hypothetical protein
VAVDEPEGAAAVAAGVQPRVRVRVDADLAAADRREPDDGPDALRVEHLRHEVDAAARVRALVLEGREAGDLEVLHDEAGLLADDEPGVGRLVGGLVGREVLEQAVPAVPDVDEEPGVALRVGEPDLAVVLARPPDAEGVGPPEQQRIRDQVLAGRELEEGVVGRGVRERVVDRLAAGRVDVPVLDHVHDGPELRFLGLDLGLRLGWGLRRLGRRRPGRRGRRLRRLRLVAGQDVLAAAQTDSASGCEHREQLPTLHVVSTSESDRTLLQSASGRVGTSYPDTPAV